MHTAPRRNHGQALVSTIESVDAADLSMLAQLVRPTHDWVRQKGFDTSGWPLDDFAGWFSNPGPNTSVYQRVDDGGEVQRFVMLHGADHDALFGVGSRREKNAVGQRAGNVATNLLLDILSPTDLDDDAPYGQVLTFAADRLWRTRTGAAHLQEHCKDWDILISTPSMHFDPTVPGQSLLGVVDAENATESADRLIRGGSAYRLAAHGQAVNKFPREKTHPAVAIDRETRRMTYDHRVVAAIREAAALLLDGWTFPDLVDKVAHRIPAYVLRGEPDHRQGTSKRSRSARNRQRADRGRPQVPLRYLDDAGTPNPDYRPETVADLLDPASGIRHLFKLTIPAKDSDTILARIDEDLDGLHPKDAYVEFMATGIYRRLMKDQQRSNSRRSRYRWAAADLGEVDEHGYILGRDTVDALKELRDRRTRPIGGSELPLSGLFDLAVDAPLYTKHGWLDANQGRFVWRTSHNGHDSAYRIYYEPHTATPHGADCHIVGYVHGDELGAALLDAVAEVLEGAGTDLTVTPPPVVAEHVQRLRQLERERDRAKEAFEAAVDALADEQLSPRARARLTDTVNDREHTLEKLEAAVATARAQQTGGARSRDVEAPLDTLIDVLARIAPGDKLPTGMAGSCNRLLKTLFRQPTMAFDPAHGAIRFSFTLELPTHDEATLRAPVTGQVRNRAVDTWLAGIGGRFWHRRRPLRELWPETTLTTSYQLGHHWRHEVAERLLDPGVPVHQPLSGPGAASLLVRCPHPTVIDLTMRFMLGEDTTGFPDQLRQAVDDLLFGSPITGSPQWTGPTCRPVVNALDEAE